MPPKQRVPSTTNGVKRKARDESDEDTPVKRTRGSGLAPSHFVPLAGAPEPDASKQRVKRTTSASTVSPVKKASPVKHFSRSPAKKVQRPILESDREEEEEEGNNSSRAGSSSETSKPLPSTSTRPNGGSIAHSKVNGAIKRIPKTEILSSKKPKRSMLICSLISSSPPLFRPELTSNVLLLVSHV